MDDSQAPGFVFIPALVALLNRAEQVAARPLTEAEVLRIREAAVVVPLPMAAVAQLVAERGYFDLTADNAWAEWQAFRSA